MGMYENMQDILRILRNDEELLRLLYYKPEDIGRKIPDPLDASLENILDKPIEERWQIIDDVIFKTQKDDDLIDKEKCRLFVYFGRRESSKRNYQTASQEVTVDILCHVDFENGDMRLARISDKINDLFALRRVTGMGLTDYVFGTPLTRTPSQYVGYRHVYKFGSTKS